MNLPDEEKSIVHNFPLELLSSVDCDTPLTVASATADVGSDSKDIGDNGDNDEATLESAIAGEDRDNVSGLFKF